jgi:hypothetical protein
MMSNTCQIHRKGTQAGSAGLVRSHLGTPLTAE